MTTHITGAATPMAAGSRQAADHEVDSPISSMVHQKVFCAPRSPSRRDDGAERRTAKPAAKAARAKN